MSHTGGELERRQRNDPFPYRRGPYGPSGPYGPYSQPGQPGQHASGDISKVVDWPELATWARGRGVLVVGLVLIALSLIWKAIFLGHFYFWQDDFHFVELALGNKLSYNYVTFVGAGHMFPAVYFIIWVWARVSLFNWASASAITLIMIAAAGLAALRLLRTLFGNRPAILVLLLIYLVSPLTMPDIRWWSAAIETVPLQVVIFLALNAQVHYVRTNRFWHALVAIVWLVVGLLFFEKALALPVLLFLVTSAFLLEGPWLRAAWRTLTKYWPSWLLQVGVLGVYAFVLKHALRTSSVQPSVPSSPGGVIAFAWDLLRDSLIPGAIGGPWQWFPSPATGGPEYAYAAAPKALAWMSIIVVAAIIGASIWARKYAWRAWAIVGVWFIGADIFPVVLGRIGALTPGAVALLGLETRYVSDVPAVLAVCVGLAFLPLADGQPDVRQRRHLRPAQGFGMQPGRLVAAALVGAFLIGSVFSVQSFVSDTTSLPNQFFIEDARVAVAEAPAGTMVFNQKVPENVMLATFGKNAMDSKVIGLMETTADKAKIDWVTVPRGTIDRLMIFGNDGRLHLAAIYGRRSAPLPKGTQRQCYPPSNGRVAIQFTGKTFKATNMLRFGYLAAGTAKGEKITVRYGNNSQQVTLESGLHTVYIPVKGSARSVVFSGTAAAGPALCIGSMSAGIVVPSSTGLTIPEGAL